MKKDLKKVRNIGISAHIDSGKTTLTERILYYTQRIHAIHEVRGKDGVGATMDSMELEKERGITIQSAATYCSWKDSDINIIDTPGHVDFTIEVERALRVLDGAVLILCSVGGVQSQSITVNRQMTRYKVPRIAFINKCDRTGANPFRVTQQLRDKLDLNAVMIQLPIGLESDLEGMIDLIAMKAVYFDGDQGDNIRIEEIPARLRDEAEAKREELLDAVSMFSDELMEAMLEESEIPEAMIHDAIRRGTLSLELTPVMVGSAYKNKGVQLLLDAVLAYLPCPTDVENTALDLDQGEAEVVVSNNPNDPLVALAFKLEDGRYGQLTYIRTYQGMIQKGDTIINSRTGKKSKVGRLVRMHANEMEEIESAGSGDIVALFGIDCASGDSFCNGVNWSMSSMHVPAPVISLAIKPVDNKAQINMSKALNRFTKEDPTFKTFVDHETSETIISGMGELHLEVYIERMKREYNAEVEVGAPQVAYRETITQRAEFDYTHKKQTGGSGQYGKVGGFMEPLEEGEYEFVDAIVGGVIPREFISSCDKGFQKSMAKGTLTGAPITGVRVTINDGSYHAVDSSDIAFQLAAIGAFKQGYSKAMPVIMEPIMKVAVEGPSEFQGAVMGSLNQRRGVIIGTFEEGNYTVVEAEMPLAEMFGYSTTLRSLTQGKAEFTMEFATYKQVPKGVAEELHKAFEAQKKDA